MKRKRPSVERRSSLARMVVERTPRTGSGPGKHLAGLAVSIGLVCFIVLTLSGKATKLLPDMSADSLLAQLSDTLSDAPPQPEPAADSLTLLHRAIISADLRTVESSLQHVSREELNRPRNGMTALMTAASVGNAQIVRALLAHGAKPNVRGAHQRTALQYTAEKNRLQAAGLLLDAGADINGADNGSLTPLIMAADRNFTRLALLLIERGANVNIQNVHGWTALMDAAEAGNLQLVKALLAAGARTQARHRNGSMAVDFARHGRHHDIVSVLSGNMPSAKADAAPGNHNQRVMPGKKGERQ